MSFFHYFHVRIYSCARSAPTSLVTMSVDSAEGEHIQTFFTNLQKQFIGVCAFFATRSENFGNFSDQSKTYILENIEALQRIVWWVHDPTLECDIDRTALFAFVVGLAEQSVLRNIKNRIQLHTDDQQQTTVAWHGDRRRIHR